MTRKQMCSYITKKTGRHVPAHWTDQQVADSYHDIKAIFG